MTRGIAVKGHKWSLVHLQDGWGPDTSDEEIQKLCDLVVERFHAIAARHKSDAHWTPYTGEVSVQILGHDADGHSKWERIDGETEEALESWREQADSEITAAWISGIL